MAAIVEHLQPHGQVNRSPFLADIRNLIAANKLPGIPGRGQRSQSKHEQNKKDRQHRQAGPARKSSDHMHNFSLGLQLECEYCVSPEPSSAPAFVGGLNLTERQRKVKSFSAFIILL